jgi:hypothetical protein
MIEVQEGQMNKTTSDTIGYPNINSCLTITCFCEGPMLVGGHCVAVPSGSQKGFMDIWQYISANAKPLDRTQLFLIGDTKTWQDNLNNRSGGKFSRLEQLGAALGLPEDTGKTKIINVSGWTNGGGMVRIEAWPIGFCKILSKDGKEQYMQIPVDWKGKKK